MRRRRTRCFCFLFSHRICCWVATTLACSCSYFSRSTAIFWAILGQKTENRKPLLVYILWENPVGKSCGKIRGENPVGKSGGKIRWENPVGKSFAAWPYLFLFFRQLPQQHFSCFGRHLEREWRENGERAHREGWREMEREWRENGKRAQRENGKRAHRENGKRHRGRLADHTKVTRVRPVRPVRTACVNCVRSVAS
jgi:hypothetical protein